MLERSSEAVDLPHKQDVEFALACIDHETIERRAGFFGARDANIQILLDNLPIASSRVLSQFIHLQINALTIR